MRSWRSPINRLGIRANLNKSNYASDSLESGDTSRSLCKKREPRIVSWFSFLVGMSGLEPPTPTLSGWCSNQLSYIPSNKIAARLAPQKSGGG